jgi:hypothetical protein
MRKTDAVVLIALLGLVVFCAGAGRMHARTLMCTTNLESIGEGVVMYADTYGGRLPQMEYNAGTSRQTQQHPFWAFRDGTPGSKWTSAIDLGCLYKSGIIANPGALYCPADSRWIDSMKAYGTGGEWGVKVPSLPVSDPLIALSASPSIACLRLNYAYWPQSKNMIMDNTRLSMIQRLTLYEIGFPDIAYKAADLDPSRAYVSDDGRHTISSSVAGGQDDSAQNALFGDGHVSFGKPPKGPDGTTYRIHQENEDIGTIGGVSNRTDRYFFYL